MSQNKMTVRNGILILSLTIVIVPFQNCGAPGVPQYQATVSSSGSGGGGDQSVLPNAATNLSLHVASDQQINLQWNDNSNNESGFRIERAFSSSGPFVSAGVGAYTALANVDANITSYVDKNLLPSTEYYYRVVTINAKGAAMPSNALSATTNSTPTAAPTAPANLLATAAAATIINLTWTDLSNNESGFKVERSQNGGTTYLLVAIVAADQANYQDTNLIPATAYTYRVRATNAAGDSANTAISTATTSAAVNTASFTYVSTNIINTNCVACHGPALAAAGINLSTYNGVLGIVTKSNSANSKIYQVISNNTMPPGAPLSTDQKLDIKNWIDAGAQNN